MNAHLKRRIAELEGKAGTQEKDNPYLTVPDYDPNNPESIKKAYEVVFGMPQAMQKTLLRKNGGLGTPVRCIVPRIPGYNPNNPESVRQAHEAVFGPVINTFNLEDRDHTNSGIQ